MNIDGLVLDFLIYCHLKGEYQCYIILLPFISDDPLVFDTTGPPRFIVESNVLVAIVGFAGDGDVEVDISTPVAPTFSEIVTKGPPPPPDCKLSLPLLRLIPSPSVFF